MEVHNILQPTVHRLVQEDHAMVAKMRDDMWAAKNGPPVGTVSAPPAPSAPAMPRFTR